MNKRIAGIVLGLNALVFLLPAAAWVAYAMYTSHAGDQEGWWGLVLIGAAFYSVQAFGISVFVGLTTAWTWTSVMRRRPDAPMPVGGQIGIAVVSVAAGLAAVALVATQVWQWR